MQMWIRRGTARDLEGALCRRRVDAPSRLVETIATRISENGAPVSRRAWSRLAFASSVSVFVLGSFASFGGLSYAASGADGTMAAVKQIVVQHTLKVTVHRSSAASQYPSTPTKPAKPHIKGQTFTPPKTAVQPKSSASASSGTLPFTGLSLLGTAVLSIVLVGLGFLLRRRERRA